MEKTPGMEPEAFIPGSKSGFIVGYDYEFADAMSAFTGDVPDPVHFAVVDPHLPSMKGMFYNHSCARSTWKRCAGPAK